MNAGFHPASHAIAERGADALQSVDEGSREVGDALGAMQKPTAAGGEHDTYSGLAEVDVIGDQRAGAVLTRDDEGDAVRSGSGLLGPIRMPHG